MSLYNKRLQKKRQKGSYGGCRQQRSHIQAAAVAQRALNKVFRINNLRGKKPKAHRQNRQFCHKYRRSFFGNVSKKMLFWLGFPNAGTRILLPNGVIWRKLSQIFRLAAWPSGLRRRFAKPLFAGSNPAAACFISGQSRPRWGLLTETLQELSVNNGREKSAMSPQGNMLQDYQGPPQPF